LLGAELSLETVEPALEPSQAPIRFVFPSPPKNRSQDDRSDPTPDGRADSPFRPHGGGGDASLELSELCVQTSSRLLDLGHRFSCALAHATSSFS
jgi:hypothetical protein